jgi:hypothetical protein
VGQGPQQVFLLPRGVGRAVVITDAARRKPYRISPGFALRAIGFQNLFFNIAKMFYHRQRLSINGQQIRFFKRAISATK